MGLIALITLVGIVALAPSAEERVGKRSVLGPNDEYISGRVSGFEEQPDGTHVKLRLDGSDEEVTLRVVGEVEVEDFRVGDHVRAVAYEDAQLGRAYAFMDFHRGWPLAVLAGLFALVVVAVARWKGLAALAGLVGGLAIIWYFLLPALLAGKNPLAVVLVTASAVMFVVVYLAHGVSVKSTTALLGTFFGTAIVTAIAWVAIPATHLTPLTSDEMVQLSWAAQNVSLKGVLLSGMVLAGVGVLNDVTITQASAVWELRAAAPAASRRSIFASSMRIGRDHIASTVYTIAFAYIGGALSLLLVASTLDHRITDLLTFDDIASELVPILAASIGLVLAIPMTSAIGAWLVGGAQTGKTGQPGSAAPSNDPDHSHSVDPTSSGAPATSDADHADSPAAGGTEARGGIGQAPNPTGPRTPSVTTQPKTQGAPAVDAEVRL
jgi:uncharacterized membrane protein